MKRPYFWITVLVLVITAGLSSYAVQPEHFTGVWYAPDGTAYQFQEGLIYKLDQNGLPEDAFGGAYSFTRSSITLFVAEQDGTSEIVTLHWAGEPDGDTLRTSKQTDSPLYFSRNRTKAVNAHKNTPIG